MCLFKLQVNVQFYVLWLLFNLVVLLYMYKIIVLRNMEKDTSLQNHQLLKIYCCGR